MVSNNISTVPNGIFSQVMQNSKAKTEADHDGHACSIIPPYMLEQIGQNAPDAEIRRFALDTLAFDEKSLADRHAPLATPTDKLPTPLDVDRNRLAVNRNIYDTHGTKTLPGDLVRAEGGAQTNDAAVTKAYDGLGATFDLFAEEYGRNSIDGKGMPLVATVHYGKNYDNAFWNGEQMVFGDGDGKIFNSFTDSLDVIGHELAHGVTEHDTQLRYQGQSGALNESISDVFGSLVKQRSLGQTADQADWLIGHELLNKNVRGVALRSMAAPGTAYDDPILGKDPQPAHMKDFVRTTKDRGGVHINSGIPNHAFYLVAKELGGYAWDKPGKIWYEALQHEGSKAITPTMNFRGFAQATSAAAARLYGQGSKEQIAVMDAWDKVGVHIYDLRETA